MQTTLAISHGGLLKFTTHHFGRRTSDARICDPWPLLQLLIITVSLRDDCPNFQLPSMHSWATCVDEQRAMSATIALTKSAVVCEA